MFWINTLRYSALCVGLLLVAGCAGEPYVLNAGEFDRSSEVFLKGVTDRKSVTICYAKSAASPAALTKMAVEECGRFGKTAKFRGQDFQTCPLLTPVAAEFDCTGASTAPPGS